MAAAARSQDDGIWIEPDGPLTNAWVRVVRPAIGRNSNILFAAEGRVTNGPCSGPRS